MYCILKRDCQVFKNISFQIHNIVVTFYSPYPNLLSIERESDVITSWQHWHFASRNCRQESGYEPEQNATSADDVICKHLLQ